MGEYDTQIVSIVDDNESLRRSLRNPLRSVGLRVETLASAEAFLESIYQERAGCLVLDLRMPGMTGFGLLTHLAGTGSRIPAVILTAHGDDESCQRSLQAGAVAALSKPFNSNALLSTPFGPPWIRADDLPDKKVHAPHPSSRPGRRQSIRSRRFASDTESGPISTWPIATATMPASTTGIERDCSQTSIMQASGMR
jgi:CheY-like chemotaxis protein